MPETPFRPLLALLALIALAGCGGTEAYHRSERFDRDARHRRDFAAAPDALCEAARKVLAGQGYWVTRTAEGGNITVMGQKEFRAEDKQFAVIQMQLNCLPAAQGSASLFATALESRYDVRQSKEKTSVGVPLLAPITITSSSSSEGQVKLRGETVEERSFYEDFFRAVTRELGLTR